MKEIFYYVLFGITALAAAPFLTGFVNLFVKQELENIKEFKPKFDLKITIVTFLAILFLFHLYYFPLLFL